MDKVERASRELPFEEMGTKQKIRWALKQFHPDITGQDVESSSPYPTPDIILGSLSKLTKYDSLESWPQSYADTDEPPKFSIQGVQGSFYLPSTPEEFLLSLWDFKTSGSHNVFLNEAPKHFSVEGGRTAFEVDTSLEKIRDSIRTMQDLPSLQRLYDTVDILSVYSPEELLGQADSSHQNLLTLINEQAIVIMKNLADKKLLTKETVEDFPFYKFVGSGEGLGLDWDSSARETAFALIHETDNSEKLAALRNIAQQIRSARSSKDLEEVTSSLRQNYKFKHHGYLQGLLRSRRRHLTKTKE